MGGVYAVLPAYEADLFGEVIVVLGLVYQFCLVFVRSGGGASRTHNTVVYNCLFQDRPVGR